MVIIMDEKKLIWKEIDSISGISYIDFNTTIELINKYKQEYNIKDLRIVVYKHEDMYEEMVLSIERRRLETDDESSRRIEKEKEDIKDRKKSDLRVLAELKKKYGNI